MNENILQSFKSESAPCIKLLSLKGKSHWIESFLKRISSRFMLTSTWNISILPRTCWSFRIGLNENANSFFATRWRFWSVKNSCFRGNAVHKTALLTNTALNEIVQSTNQHRSRKGGVWKNELLSELFGSCWANRVKINAYYRALDSFFPLVALVQLTFSIGRTSTSFGRSF